MGKREMEEREMGKREKKRWGKKWGDGEERWEKERERWERERDGEERGEGERDGRRVENGGNLFPFFVEHKKTRVDLWRLMKSLPLPPPL